ncbi:MAG: hypothetical protein MJ106_03625 [Lentisphaeria bacterium]|nr:hypothetical protein [Lentisphaeria bacterium]
MFLGITLLALLGFSWTIIGGVDNLAARKNANIPRILFYQGLVTILIGIVVMAIQREHFNWHDSQFLLLLASLVVSGIAAYLANFFLCFSMARGPNGIIWSIYQAAMMIPFVMGISIHHDKLTPSRLVGIILLFIGLMALGIGGDMRKRNKNAHASTTESATDSSARTSRKRLAWLIPALLAFLTNGMTMYTLALPSRFQNGELEISSIARSSFLHVGLLLGSLAHACFKKGIVATPTKLESNIFMAFVLIGIINYYALQFPGIDLLTNAGAGAIALAIPVGVCVSAFTIYSALHLKEKYTLTEWAGLFSCAIGVVAISC